MEFTEADTKTLCTTICCPCGMMINPRESISDQPPTIHDPGHLISMVAEKWLLMTSYAKMHQAHTSRLIESQLMNQSFIMSISPLRKQELAYSDPQEIDNPLKDT